MSDVELNHRTGEFYFGTFGEFSIGIDSLPLPINTVARKTSPDMGIHWGDTATAPCEGK